MEKYATYVSVCLKQFSVIVLSKARFRTREATPSAPMIAVYSSAWLVSERVAVTQDASCWISLTVHLGNGQRGLVSD